MISHVTTVNSQPNSDAPTAEPKNIIAIPVKDVDSKLATKSDGLFSDDIVFCHEDIIERGLTIVNNNPDSDIGIITKDVRLVESADKPFKQISFNHTLPIFKPWKKCITAITQHYKNKYNIDIYYLQNNEESREVSVVKLAQQLNDEQQIGIIGKFFFFNLT